MDAEEVGWTANDLPLSKHSGKAAIRSRLKNLGFVVSDDALIAIVAKVKELGDKKKEILDDELSAIADEYLEETSQINRYKLDYVAVPAGTETPSATIRLLKLGGKS